MKKKALALILASLLLLSAAACGASSAKGAATASYAADTQTAAEAPAAENGYGGIAADESRGTAPGAPDGTGAPVGDKIIYSAYAEIETRDFETSVEGVYALIDRFGGFLESSSVTGKDYSGNRSTRSADFVIRVPSAKFSALTDSLTELGNVPFSSTNAENITARYNDTQSKLDAYEIEYDRLLAMLEKAETVEEMLAIEARLSDVRYNIQTLSNTISGWDSLLSYSTVELHLQEVAEYTDQPQETKTYWQEVGAALSSTLRSLGRFFKGLFKGLVAFAPVLLILAAVGAAAVLVARRVLRPEKRRGARKKDDGKGESGRDDS